MDYAELKEIMKDRGVDHAILEEIVAINMLPFVAFTSSSCSGHVSPWYNLNGDPYILLKYRPDRTEADQFENDLLGIQVNVAGLSLRIEKYEAGDLVGYKFALPRNGRTALDALESLWGKISAVIAKYLPEYIPRELTHVEREDGRVETPFSQKGQG